MAKDKKKQKETYDIKSLSKSLTVENKRCVIAVANALLFSQKNMKTGLNCNKHLSDI